MARPRLNLASTGVGTSGLTDLPLTAQTINVSGSVFLVAQPSLPASVSLGNAHVGGTLSQAFELANTLVAAGFQEGLNASVGTTSNASGSGGPIVNLAAGSSSSAISVGMTAASAGVQNGSVTLNLASNGTGSSGLATLDLAPQVVNTSITGYNLAKGTINNAGDFNFGCRAGGQRSDHQDDLAHQLAGGGRVLGSAERGLRGADQHRGGELQQQRRDDHRLAGGADRCDVDAGDADADDGGGDHGVIPVAADLERDGDR